MGTIAEKLTYLEGTKSAIKDAIIAKGVEVTDADTFRNYAEKIESIEAGGSCESQSKEISITDNGTRVVTPDEGYLLDQVTVTTNVTTGKPQLPNGISFGGSTWTTFDTDPYDWSQIYSGTEMFQSCFNIKTLSGTGIENVYFLDFYETFSGCNKLVSIPKLQGKPRNIESMFFNCSSLENPDLSGIDFSDTVTISRAFMSCKEWVQNIDLSSAPIRKASYAFSGARIKEIPNINYSKLEVCDNMFSSCSMLKNVNINLPNAININGMFKDCLYLTEIHFEGLRYCETIDQLFWNCNRLTTITGLDCTSVTSMANTFSSAYAIVDIDGLFNLGANFISNYTVNINPLQSLSRESYLNIFNTIYDFVGNGSSIRCVLDVHPNAFTILSEEDIAIATAKGWTIQ